MNKVFLILLISLAQCFTIYTKDEIILESKKIDFKNRKTKKDIFTLRHSLKKEGLHLSLEEYRAEEENQVDFIQETYKVNKTLTNPKPIDRNIEIKRDDNSCKDAMFVMCLIIGAPAYYIAQYIALVIVAPILLIELPTLPFRLYPEEKTRIREEIRKGKITYIGKALEKEKILIFLNSKSSKEYEFKENQIFIPLEELELEYKNNFTYQLLNPKTRKLLSEGNFNLSEDISNNEINLLIQRNRISKEELLCKKEYPFLENKDTTYKNIETNIKQFCRNKYTEPANSILYFDKFDECIKGIKSCYEITQNSE